jgi:hypothetical protein
MKISSLGLDRTYPVDLADTVRVLLRRLPPEHVMGLARITISGGAPLDEAAGSDVLGQYFEAYEGEPAFIMLYPEEMAKEVPCFVRRVPLVWRVLVAETLFHEVGHHYQRFTHGIRKPAQEDHAENYGLRYAQAAFPLVYRLLRVWHGVKRVARRGKLWWLERRRAWGWVTAEELYELGRMHWECGNWNRVVEAWEGALNVDPEYAVAREWLPRARWRLQNERRRQTRLRGLRSRAGRSRNR